MTAREVFEQQDGKVTKAYYADMNQRGLLGQLAVALFRAQKRSTAAKKYRRGSNRREAYDVKNWSLSEICRILCSQTAWDFTPQIMWGWKRDPKTPGFEWVLYIELPSNYGQVSFHSAERIAGPSYLFDWDGEHKSKERILAFCDSVAGNPVEQVIISKPEPASPWDRMKNRLQNLDPNTQP